MRAFAIERPGEAGSVHELERPEIGERDALVRVRAAGVNPVDWKKRDGAKDREFPMVLGQDFAGDVERAGAGITQIDVGARIFGIARRYGAYAEYTIVTQGEQGEPFAQIPGGMSYETAAALPTAGLTALAAVDTLDVRQGSSFLVIGAAGGVGAFAMQIAKWRSANVLAVAASEQEQFAHQTGADVFIASDKGDYIEGVLERYPGGVDAVLDLQSNPDEIKRVAQILHPDGMLVSTIRSVDEQWFANHGIAAQNVNLEEMPQSSADGLRQLATLVTTGAVSVHIAEESDLNAAGALLDKSKRHAIAGKAVLKI